jgi:hypothetical protein
MISILFGSLSPLSAFSITSTTGTSISVSAVATISLNMIVAASGR